ncbi:MAG TPA: hypothetical protein VN894_02750 [Polyangiaceae bacterium]|nr:hypothetical protein [Polyangiaceae bacterium]
MSSSWPILVGFLAIVVAAFWYDATVAPASGHLSEAPAPAAQPR